MLFNYIQIFKDRINMKSLSTLVIFAFLPALIVTQDTPPPDDGDWNILSLDGGGIRGLITAQVAKYMEQYAYNYSTQNLCYPVDPQNERISLSKIFDMVAGTSTGSLLATSVVIPEVNNLTTNRYYADDAIEIYTTRGKDVFQKYVLSPIFYALGIIGFSAVGGMIGLQIGKKIYKNREHEESIKDLKMLIKKRKYVCKRKDNESQEE